jgi:hypothetical protein
LGWPRSSRACPISALRLQQAPRAIKRQVFDALGLQITYGKLGRRIEISATISEATADALENAKNLPAEALDRSLVAPRDVAGPDMSLRTTLRSFRTLGWRPELPG